MPKIPVAGEHAKTKRVQPKENPREKSYDTSWLVRPRVWQKVFLKKDHHNLIIPGTKNHAAWYLSAQPLKRPILQLLKKHTGRFRIVSMLSKKERLMEGEIGADGRETAAIGKREVEFTRMPWYDHGALDLSTGKIQTVASMRAFQEKLGATDEIGGENDITLCHCMAGRSRSLVTTLTFLFYNAKTVFDYNLDELVDTTGKLKQANAGNSPWHEIFQKMSKEKGEDYTVSLMRRLKDNPSYSDIAEYVQIMRPVAKPFAEMDGEQAGLVGLMSLSRAASGIRVRPEPTAGTSVGEMEYELRLLTDARDIGMMLRAPLDSAMRDADDRKAQEENLVTVFEAYQKQGINLLTAMINPRDGISILAKTYDAFLKHFDGLRPNEQARFAILLKGLEDKGHSLNLGERTVQSADLARMAVQSATKSAAEYKAHKAAEKKKRHGVPKLLVEVGGKIARALSKNKTKKAADLAEHELKERAAGLSAGDQIELLKSFGLEVFLTETYTADDIGHFNKEIIEKIQHGSSLDEYNHGIHLAELYSAMDSKIGGIGDNKGSTKASAKQKIKDETETAFSAMSTKAQLQFLSHLKEINPDLYVRTQLSFAELIDEKAIEKFLRVKDCLKRPDPKQQLDTLKEVIGEKPDLKKTIEEDINKLIKEARYQEELKYLKQLGEYDQNGTEFKEWEKKVKEKIDLEIELDEKSPGWKDLETKLEEGSEAQALAKRWDKLRDEVLKVQRNLKVAPPAQVGSAKVPPPSWATAVPKMSKDRAATTDVHREPKKDAEEDASFAVTPD